VVCVTGLLKYNLVAEPRCEHMHAGTHVAGTIAGAAFNFDPVANPDLARWVQGMNSKVQMACLPFNGRGLWIYHELSLLLSST